MQHPLVRLAAVAADPWAYAAEWKERTGRPVVGSLPMNFPGEVIHASGALPFVLQASTDPITAGNSVFPVFYCGFSRSLVDQSMRGKFDVLDGLLFVDNCVQVLGAADVIRAKLRELPTRYFQLNSSITEPTSKPTAIRAYGGAVAELELLLDTTITDAGLREGIELFNTNRRLLRHIHSLRQTPGVLTSRQMQVLVTSSMVMDKAEHNALLQELIPEFEAVAAEAPRGVRVHLSGHMCHAPKPELLDLIEECGAVVVNDDLYHGLRWFSTDVELGPDPVEALADWYLRRDANAPCPTRVLGPVAWDQHILKAVRDADAQGVIVLMAKFCEPHMYFYPELRQSFDREHLPNLLIETEHEGMPMEATRTRVESFVETVRHSSQHSYA